MSDIILKKFYYHNDDVILVYNDYNILIVSRSVFDRAFGCIVSLPMDIVKRDFVKE